MTRLTETETRLCDLIARRRLDLLDDLRLHVGLPTGGANCDALDETRETLSERLERLGAVTTLVPGDSRPDWLFNTRSDLDPPPTAVCRHAGPGPRILIAGHLDTVHDPEGAFQSLELSSDEQTATGPGCVDMKGGLVITVAALEALAECGVESAWTFVMNSDEETGSYCSEAVLTKEAQSADIGLAIEPALAHGELAVERLGSGQFVVEATGRSAHVGRAFEEGVSAVTALAECLIRTARMPDPAHGRILSIGPIEGGVATNAVPDRARAWGNVRFPTQDVADELGAMLDALQTDPGAMPRVVVRRSFNRPAKPLIDGTRRLAQAARHVAESLDQTLPFARTGGVCDGNILQAAGLPTIDTLGVRGGGLHTPDEWIEVASLVQRSQLMAVLLSRLAAGDPALAPWSEPI